MPISDELLLKLEEIGAADLAKSLDSVGKELDALATSQDKIADSAAKSEEGFKGAKMGLADLKAGLDMVTNVGGKVLDFFKESVDETVKYAAEVRDLSRAIGASAEESSSLIQVADDMTVSVGTLEAAFKAAIKKGIQPNIAQLAKLSDEYKSITDPVQRSQFAMEKFGRAGLEMAKILEQGGDAIRASAAEAKKLGLTLSEDAVKNARQFEIQMDNLGDKADALKLKFGQAAVPALNSFFDTLSQGVDVMNTLTNGISATGDAYEMKLTSAIATAATMWGAESSQVQELSVKLRDYLILRQQVGMTEQESTTRKAMLNVKTIEETASVQAASDAQDRYYASLANAAQKQLEDAAAKDAAAKADAIYRAGVSETIGKIDSMAQSLAKATDAQAKQMLAQGALDTILQAQKEGKISAEEAARATDLVMLKYDLTTPKALAMAKAQEEINKQYLAGHLPFANYLEDIDKLPKLAEDGKITMDELRKLGISPTTAATVEQTGKVDLLSSAWKNVPREVITEYTIVQHGTVPGRAYGGPVSAGLPYIVGERGPELFVPRASGDIISNQTTNNYSITTDRTGLAFLFERQRQAEARM